MLIYIYIYIYYDSATLAILTCPAPYFGTS